MTGACELCGLRPASVREGKSNLCPSCAARRRATKAALPLAGAALTAAALVAGGAFLLESLSRREGGSPDTNPIADWTPRLQPGNTPTLAAFSRALTELPRPGKLDLVLGRHPELDRVIS